MTDQWPSQNQNLASIWHWENISFKARKFAWSHMSCVQSENNDNVRSPTPSFSDAIWPLIMKLHRAGLDTRPHLPLHSPNLDLIFCTGCNSQLLTKLFNTIDFKTSQIHDSQLPISIYYIYIFCTAATPNEQFGQEINHSLKEASPRRDSKRNWVSLNKCPSYTEIFSKRRKIYT